MRTSPDAQTLANQTDVAVRALVVGHAATRDDVNGYVPKMDGLVAQKREMYTYLESHRFQPVAAARMVHPRSKE